MRKFLLLALSLSSLLATAQNTNPRGLYRLQNFRYDDGTTKAVDFSNMVAQYKYFGDNVTLTIAVMEDTDGKDGMTRFSIRNQDRRVLNYTGDEPVGEDGKGTRVFGSKGNVIVKWYNKDIRNHPSFPYQDYTSEVYSSKKNISPNIAKSIDLLKMNVGKRTNPYVGVWRRRGNGSVVFSVTDESKVRTQQDEMYRIFTDKDVLMMWRVQDKWESMFAYCELWPYTVPSEDGIVENGHTCIIKWISEDTFSLTYIDKYGEAEVEFWDRCGLPENFQTLFNTHEPTDQVKPSVPPIPYESYQHYFDMSHLVGTWVCNNRANGRRNITMEFKEDSTFVARVVTLPLDANEEAKTVMSRGRYTAVSGTNAGKLTFEEHSVPMIFGMETDSTANAKNDSCRFYIRVGSDYATLGISTGEGFYHFESSDSYQNGDFTLPLPPPPPPSAPQILEIIDIEENNDADK